MSDKQTWADRRDVLRGGAALGGGLLASAFAGGSVATDHNSGSQTEIVGYISRSSYRKLSGEDDVSCVPNVEGWGDTCHVKRVAEDSDGETGVSIELPSDRAGDGRVGAYTVTADDAVDLAGGPSGHGPWKQPCGSWLFVGDATVETGAVYRVTGAENTESLGSAYEGVTATDSEGEEIGSPMDLVRVSLERLSPGEQWRQVGKLTRGGLDAGFGVTTALDGDTAVVGADSENSVYVFTQSDHGWTRQATLGEDVSVIGSEVAISGDTVLVDAPNDAVERNDAVRVFTRSDGDWEHQVKLAPDDLARDDRFARAFDIDGDTLAVGAPEDNGANGDSEGTVYVFTRSGGTWSQAAVLEDTSSDVTDDAEGLGYDVAVDGDTIVAGAPYTIYYDFGYSSVGGALVFTRSGGSWSQQAFLRSDELVDEDLQGQSVAVENDTAVVASHDAHTETVADADAGAAWVYSRDGSDWSQQAKLTPAEWDTRNWFAYSISLDGDRLLVGSDVFDGLGNDAQGAAYLFTRDGTDWRQLRKLTADDGDPYDRFGYDVALDGDAAFVCAADERGGNAAQSGSAYLFQR